MNIRESPVHQIIMRQLREKRRAQGREEGREERVESEMERGARETAIRSVLVVLKTRFPGWNLQPIEQALETIRYTDNLTWLVQIAMITPTVEAYLLAIDIYEYIDM